MAQSQSICAAARVPFLLSAEMTFCDSMKKGRFTRPLRLSRNYSFADKQERTVGRSKVVRKFLYRNFLPPEVQKGRYPCAASRPRCADTCSPLLSICRANAVSCALPREMLTIRLFRQTARCNSSAFSFALKRIQMRSNRLRIHIHCHR